MPESPEGNGKIAIEVAPLESRFPRHCRLITLVPGERASLFISSDLSDVKGLQWGSRVRRVKENPRNGLQTAEC